MKRLTDEERARRAYLATRGGKGRERVQIQRSVVATMPDGKRVTGNAIVIRPRTFTRDAIKALNHFCKQRGIVLSPIESVTHTPAGLTNEVTRAISYLAICPVSEMRALTEHSYIGPGNWQFATTVRVSGQTTLAKMPKVEVKESDLPPHPHDTALQEHEGQ